MWSKTDGEIHGKNKNQAHRREEGNQVGDSVPNKNQTRRMKPSEPHSNMDENFTPYRQHRWTNLIKHRITLCTQRPCSEHRRKIKTWIHKRNQKLLALRAEKNQEHGRNQTEKSTLKTAQDLEARRQGNPVENLI
jgi:hypothetical protein